MGAVRKLRGALCRLAVSGLALSKARREMRGRHVTLPPARGEGSVGQGAY